MTVLSSPPDINDPEYEIKIRDWEVQVHEAAQVARAEEKLKADLALNGDLANQDREDFWKSIGEVRHNRIINPEGPCPENMELCPQTARYLGIEGFGLGHVMSKIQNGGGFYGPGDFLIDVDSKGKEAIVWVANKVHDNTHDRLGKMFDRKDATNPQGEEVASVQAEHMANHEAPGSTPRGGPIKKVTSKHTV